MHSATAVEATAAEFLVVLIYYWTLGAFVVSLLAIIAAKIVHRLRSRRGGAI
jgi:hypothetical protein